MGKAKTKSEDGGGEQLMLLDVEHEAYKPLQKLARSIRKLRDEQHTLKHREKEDEEKGIAILEAHGLTHFKAGEIEFKAKTKKSLQIKSARKKASDEKDDRED